MAQGNPVGRTYLSIVPLRLLVFLRRVALPAAVSVFAVGSSSANQTYYDNVRTVCLFPTTTFTCTSCHSTTSPTPNCVGYVSMTTLGRRFCDGGKQACPVCTDNDGDGSRISNGGCGQTDCNDNNANIYPGHAETCDNLNNDCNATTADGSGESWYHTACDGTDADLCNEGQWNCASGVRTCSDTTGNTLDLCNGNTNDDCNTATADGSGESWYHQPCDGADGDLCTEGQWNCTSGVKTCSDNTTTTADICNGVDDDCDASSADGSEDPAIGQACDGADSDLCSEGTRVCVAGALQCNDQTSSTVDLCNGLDDDCNGATADGSAEAWYGSPCDGADDDLCAEGTYACTSGAQSCTDTSSSSKDVCNGVDDDCDASSADGSEDPAIGQACDGADSDLCPEGTNTCVAGALQCSDQTSSTVDLCNGLDDDCNPATVDGSAEPWSGQPCDGPDDDLCAEGAYACVSGAQSCTDTSSSSADVCNGVDDDCDPSSTDGSEDPAIGQACDGPDTDLCPEGVNTCVAGALQCNDQTSSTVDLCNGVDDDCNPATADGSGEPWFGQTCDGPDGDLCAEGTYACVGGAQSCTDTSSSSADVCNGVDDDCDASSADGSEDPAMGQACDGADSDLCPEGTNTCVAGALQCSDQTSSTVDLCNGLDDDCNPATVDGSAEPWSGQPCDGPDDDLCAEGTYACVSGAQSCTDTSSSSADVCNGIDDDCDASSADGSEDPANGQACDGADTDLCPEGVNTCVAGALQCNDQTSSTVDLCNGLDDDCNPATVDGSAEPTIGQACDGSDADLCPDGAMVCQGGALACDDPAEAGGDRCNGVDDDCNVATADGSGEPWFGQPCDGADTDLCLEGLWTCTAGVQTCTDTTGSTSDTCNGSDDDCDPSTADGSGDPTVGHPCDGDDGDLCPEGTRVCSSGAVTCNDNTGTTVDLCNGLDDDCDPGSVDGSEDPGIGQSCDGADGDLCPEGVTTCVGGASVCSDASSTTVDLCNGLDDDCDPSTADGSGDPTVGQSCDGNDGDLCKEGTRVCSSGAVTCNDVTGTTVDLCNGLDDDCDPASADGSEDPAIGQSCDGPDGDLCPEGVTTCVSGASVCSDASTTTVEVCNGLDDDCNPSTADGAGEPTIGQPCDGSDVDSCTDGIIVCLNASLSCNDDASAGLDLCNGVDDDCNPATADGSGETWIGQPCDGPDGDSCAEGVSTCSGGARACTDATSTTVDLCNGLDDDCNAATQDGSAEDWFGAPCDGPDSDLCLEGTQQCVAGHHTCGDTTTDTLEGREVAGSCADQVDNDCDGNADQADPGCNVLDGADVIAIPASAFVPVVSNGINGGLRLDGTDDFVTISGNAALSFTHFTLEAYVFLDDAVSSRGVIVSGGAATNFYSLEIAGSATAPALVFTIHTGSGPDYRVTIPPSVTVPIARWIQVAVTVNSPEVALWIDGVVVATVDDAPGVAPDGAAGLLFGRGIGTGPAARFYRGGLDEIRLFNSAAIEVADHVGRVIDPSTASLTGYWSFDESAGTGVVRDATTHHIDGSLGSSAANGTDDPTRIVPAAPLEGYPSDVSTCVGALSGTGAFAAPIALQGGSHLRSVGLVVGGSDTPAPTSLVLQDLDAGENPAEAGQVPSLSTFEVSVATAGASSAVETLVSSPQDHVIQPDQNGMVALLSANPAHAVYGIRIGFDPAVFTSPQDLTVVTATLDPLETTVDGKQAPLVDSEFEGYASGGSGTPSRLVGPLLLPDGSNVLSFSMSAWDDDATADAVGEVHEVAAATGVDRVIASVSTSSADPSVRLFVSVPPGTVSIDNQSHYYYLQVVVPRGINVAVLRIRHSGSPVVAPDLSILSAAGVTAKPIPPASTPRRVTGGGLRLDDGGQAKFPVVLPSGAVVTELRLDARSTASVPRTTLYRYRPPTSNVGFCPNVEPIAAVEASPGNGTQVARSSFVVPSAAPISNGEFFYELEISDSETAGQSDVVGVQVLYAEDSDHDGVLNREDNCALDSNPTQSDADLDGIGDVCDSCFDLDGDGYGDPGHPLDACPTDNCPGIANATQEDTDGDAVGNVCDLCPTVQDPLQQDRDNDGFGDACETGHRLADIDLSGRVDGFDLAAMARAFGSSVADPRYDPRADLNRDDQVDGEDLALLAPHFGR